MIPLPQTPWTLAIAELLGLRLGAPGSSDQPADLLANLLPNGEPPPEGWFQQFLAGTAVPGYPSPGSSPSVGSTTLQDLIGSARAGDPRSDALGAGQPPLSDLTNAASSVSPPGDAAEGLNIPPQAPGVPGSPTEGQSDQAGYDAVQQFLGHSVEPNVDLSVAGRDSAPEQSDAGVSNPNSSEPGPRVGPNAGTNSNPAAGNAGGPSDTGPSTVGQATEGFRRVQITVEFDPRKMIVEMKSVAETVTHRILDRQNLIYASQTKGTITGGWR